MYVKTVCTRPQPQKPRANTHSQYTTTASTHHSQYTHQQHPHLEVPRTPVKPLLRPRQHRLVVVRAEQPVLCGRQRPHPRPLINVGNPWNELQPLPSWGAVHAEVVVEKCLKQLQGSWVGHRIRVPAWGKAEKVDQRTALAVVCTKVAGVVQGHLHVDDQQWYKATCGCLVCGRRGEWGYVHRWRRWVHSNTQAPQKPAQFPQQHTGENRHQLNFHSNTQVKTGTSQHKNS